MTIGYSVEGRTRWRPRYGPEYVIRESSSTDEGGGTFQDARTGCFSTRVWPRKVIALTSESGFGRIMAGVNPSPEYRNTMSESSETGSGRKSPVSLLLTTSIESPSKFQRKML